jgi:tetratricopeptide (TPR) repeat protein
MNRKPHNTPATPVAQASCLPFRANTRGYFFGSRPHRSRRDACATRNRAATLPKAPKSTVPPRPLFLAPRLISSALAALALFLCSFTAHAELSKTEIADLFSQGKELFRQANEIAASKPLEARDLYRKAALRFERITREGGVQNGKLHYNIGNAYFRINDFGRAILNYRRAEQFIPNDPNLQQNLESARKRRTDRIEEQQKTKVLKTVFFWHYDLSARTRSTIFTIAFLALWGCAAARLFFPRPFLKWIIGVSAVFSVIFLASILVELSNLKQHRPGVILAQEVVARKGDSDTYQPSFKEPLHAGTEFIMVEDRGDWLHLELIDSRRCWIPAKAAGLVR